MMTRADLPPLRLITVFDAVRRTGSLQRAATELNVTQPAVSQAIKALEDHIGAELLDRNTRPASLTQAGMILQGSVSRGLTEIAEGIAQIRALDNADANSVTVACTVGTATYWLMPCLTSFHEKHTDIAVSVHTVATGMPRVTTGVDLAIRYGMGDWTDGVALKLLTERVIPVCSPELHDFVSERGEGLDHMPLIHVNSGQRDWMGWEDYLKRTGATKVPRRGLQFTNYVQATQAAIAGQGIMLGWKSMTGELVKSGKLAELSMPAVIPEEAFFLILPEIPSTKPAVNVLVEWLLSVAQQ